MIGLGDRLPDYFREKFQLTATVTLAALFSLLMLMVSSHFSANGNLDMNNPDVFNFICLYYGVSLLVVCGSKRLMYANRGNEMTWLTYILWNFAEVVVISVAYAVMAEEAAAGGYAAFKLADVGNVFVNAVIYNTISLGIPYLIAGMYFMIQDKDNTIRLINYGNVVSDEAPGAFENQKITLFDSTGTLKLSVSESNLYYIESDDNYIKVWYTDSEGVLKQYMLRCRLKTVEDSFRGSNLLRCHRQYIVNMSHVKVLSREKTGYVITLDREGVDPIPVTKTYEDQILDTFNSR